MAYLIDSDVLIRAKNHEYGFDFCPGFWDWLDTANGGARVFSVDAVFDELTALDDDLSEWVRRRSGLFIAPDEPVVRALGRVIRWANESRDYDLVAKEDFAAAADSSLIAAAMVRGDVVVTHETAGDSRKRIKIPNAAAAHGVKVMSPYTMLRTEKARFVLGRAA